MIDLPILFQPPMVRAILREIEAPGTGKTQTRRPGWQEPHLAGIDFASEQIEDFESRGWNMERRGSLFYVSKPTPWMRLYDRWARGERDVRLWVREPWVAWPQNCHALPKSPVPHEFKYRGVIYGPGEAIFYRADYDRSGRPTWFPAIHMPRWASRITLDVTDVRLERLQEITPADAIAEGILPSANSLTIDCDTPDPREEFRDLWRSIHGPGAWEANPEVVVIGFRPRLRNIDEWSKAAARAEAERMERGG